jgi:hypothetical protein
MRRALSAICLISSGEKAVSSGNTFSPPSLWALILSSGAEYLRFVLPRISLTPLAPQLAMSTDWGDPDQVVVSEEGKALRIRRSNGAPRGPSTNGGVQLRETGYPEELDRRLSTIQNPASSPDPGLSASTQLLQAHRPVGRAAAHMACSMMLIPAWPHSGKVIQPLAFLHGETFHADESAADYQCRHRPRGDPGHHRCDGFLPYLRGRERRVCLDQILPVKIFYAPNLFSSVSPRMAMQLTPRNGDYHH